MLQKLRFGHFEFLPGLWVVELRGDDFVVRVAKGRFQEGSVDGRSLLEREGTSLVFDERVGLRAGVGFFGWHAAYHRI